ncbi:protein Daple-like [Hoplias malabaricus]|uniref:protein Daple-like n=1 Tax=Hoplias malabaricus TaxID=27720 RepID=UPI003463139D
MYFVNTIALVMLQECERYRGSVSGKITSYFVCYGNNETMAVFKNMAEKRSSGKPAQEDRTEEELQLDIDELMADLEEMMAIYQSRRSMAFASNLQELEIGRYDLFLPVVSCRTCLVSWTPEVQWGGKNQTGAGTTLGEEVEQVNSFLSRVALTTKYMSKAGKKPAQILQTSKEVKEDIEAIKKSTGKSDEELQQWVTDVKQWAVDTPDDLSTDDPVRLQHLIESLFLGIQQKKRDLYRVTDRNKQRHKIRRRIAEDKIKLSDAISQYNDLSTSTESVDSVEDLLVSESPIWPWDSELDTSLGMKKKVFDKVMQLERLIEEEAILLREMKQHWNHLTRTCKALRDQAGVISEDLAANSYPSGVSDQAYHGLHSAVLQKLEELKTELLAVKETYHQIVVGHHGTVVEEENEDPYEDVSTDASTDDEL